MEQLRDFSIAIILSAVETIVGGFLFMTLWKWFIVTSFQITPLSLIQAIGVMFFIKHLRRLPEDKSFDEFVKESLRYILSCGVMLGFAWVITLFY